MSGDLQDLIRRVEAASGPDREVDILIHCAVRGYVDPAPENPVGRLGRGSYTYGLNGKRYHARGEERTELTRSLDAALALVDRVLPGSVVSLERRATESVAEIWPADICAPGARFASEALAWTVGKTPALALCLALLKALEAQHG